MKEEELKKEIEEDKEREELNRQIVEFCKIRKIIGSHNFPFGDYLISFEIRKAILK